MMPLDTASVSLGYSIRLGPKGFEEGIKVDGSHANGKRIMS